MAFPAGSPMPALIEAARNRAAMQASAPQTPAISRPQIYGNAASSLVPAGLQMAYGMPNSYANYQAQTGAYAPKPVVQTAPQQAAPTQAQMMPMATSANSYNALANKLAMGQQQNAPFVVPMSMVNPWLMGSRG